MQPYILFISSENEIKALHFLFIAAEQKPWPFMIFVLLGFQLSVLGLEWVYEKHCTVLEMALMHKSKYKEFQNDRSVAVGCDSLCSYVINNT